MGSEKTTAIIALTIIIVAGLAAGAWVLLSYMDHLYYETLPVGQYVITIRPPDDASCEITTLHKPRVYAVTCER